MKNFGGFHVEQLVLRNRITQNKALGRQIYRYKKYQILYTVLLYHQTCKQYYVEKIVIIFVTKSAIKRNTISIVQNFIATYLNILMYT